MKRKFSIIKRELSMDEKKERLKMYNLYKFPFDPIEFLNRGDIYDETIHLKCTKCKYDEIADYEIIEEITFGMDYPMFDCPECSHTKLKGILVPIDIYNSDFKKQSYLNSFLYSFSRSIFFCLNEYLESPNRLKKAQKDFVINRVSTEYLH